MISLPCWTLGKPRRQHGAALVEFALVASIFFLLMLGIFEFGRLMFHWNTTVEATRSAVRLAVVCDWNDAQIKSKFQSILPIVTTPNIKVDYYPSTCTGANDCEAITVEVSASAPAIQYYIPFQTNSWQIPKFSTTLTRESLQTGSGNDKNPDC